MSIFLTGAGSFIGHRLIHVATAQGHDLSGIDLAPPSLPTFSACDLRAPDLADAIPENTEVVVHLAAISRDPDCRKDPRGAFDVNIQGTLNLLDACVKRQVRQLIFASSEWVYGSVENVSAQTEEDPIDVTRLHSEYALSKIVGEQVLRLTHAQGGPAVTVLRFGIVYGPRDDNWSAVESLFHSVMENKDIEVGSLQTARRFIHVDDICGGIMSVLGRSGFEVFNLSGNELISLGDVISVSGSVVGTSPKVVETAPQNISIRNPDNTKIREQVGWEQCLSLAAGLHTLKEHFETQAQ